VQFPSFGIRDWIGFNVNETLGEWCRVWDTHRGVGEIGRG